MTMPRKLELVRRGRVQALLLQLVARETDFEAVVSAMAKIESEQACELAVHRQEHESGRALTATVEVFPPDEVREPRHERRFFPEFGKRQGAPKPSEQGETEEFTTVAGRQPEDRRELAKERDFLGPDRRLHRTAAAKELEPSRVRALRCLDVAAKRRLVDEPLRAVEAPSTGLRREVPFELVLDRPDQVRHYATPVGMPDIGSAAALAPDLPAFPPGAPASAAGSRQ